jgi:ribosome recycling factor
VAVRAARRDANDLIKDAQKDGDLTEDEKKQGDKKVQDLTDKFVALVDEVAAAKEKEIMEL